MWRFSILALAACAATEPRGTATATPAGGAGACKDQPPVGDPSQLTLISVPGFSIAAPLTCAAGSYIRIERLAGTRKLGTAQVQDGSFREGCLDLANPAACSTINFEALFGQAMTELQHEGITTAGNGAGPCASNLDGGYAGWNMAIGVHDWRDADRLVAKLTELMDRYDVAGYLGASIYTIPCAILI
jgi:hypothetical protein